MRSQSLFAVAKSASFRRQVDVEVIPAPDHRRAELQPGGRTRRLGVSSVSACAAINCGWANRGGVPPWYRCGSLARSSRPSLSLL